VLAELNDKTVLASYLPWKFAIPFSGQDSTMQYQTFLMTKQTQMSTFSIIVQWGLTSVKNMWPDVVRLGVVDDGQIALSAIDNLGSFSGPSNLLTISIQNALIQLEKSISTARGRIGGGIPITSTEFPGSEQLTFQLEALSAIAWITWATLTVAVGYCVLIWFNKGFGTSLDLGQCFLWGAGVPIVSQGFGSLSAAAVSSIFSLQIPRT
jgi:hypothetical protein